MMPPGAVQSAAYEQRSGRQPWGIWTLAEKMNVDAIGGQMVFSNTDTVVLPAETGGRGLGGDQAGDRPTEALGTGAPAGAGGWGPVSIGTIHRAGWPQSWGTFRRR